MLDAAVGLPRPLAPDAGDDGLHRDPVDVGRYTRTVTALGIFGFGATSGGGLSSAFVSSRWAFSFCDLVSSTPVLMRFPSLASDSGAFGHKRTLSLIEPPGVTRATQKCLRGNLDREWLINNERAVANGSKKRLVKKGTPSVS